jgi:hypothetical protein
LLNRLFVTIGLLVILAIAAAFLVPRFIQWGDYRERLEAMAGKAFGTEVAIEGDIHLTLLPQPELEFTNVRVGPKPAPLMQVAKVQAEFSLVDFIRDRYNVTRLELDQPVVNVGIGADGKFTSGIVIADNGGQSNVSIDNADVVDGSIRLSDGRSSQTYAAESINGQLKLEALHGPFSFQGTAKLNGAGYGVRVGTGQFSAATTTLSLYIKPDDNSFTFQSDGMLQGGPTPKYSSDITYRLPPPKPKQGEAIDAGRGDFVLTGKLEAAADRVLLTDYTALPDENRSATRLTGAAELKLGKDLSFNAVVSGGVIALPPRDATTELTDPPYELVRLLGETPLPPVPPIPGTIGMDITELNLRAVSLRDLRLDAATDAHGWTIKDFAATLPGGTKVGLTGSLSAADGHPAFAGGVTLATDRLDLLASLWRKPSADNPLFNVPGALSADVALGGDALTVSNGKLTLGNVAHDFTGKIGFGADKQLQLTANLGDLDPTESMALGALMPDMAGSGSFGATFPKGLVNVSASKATLFGLAGTNLAASADWDGGVLEFSKLSADDLGGAAFDAKLTAFGTLLKPELSGTATVKVAAAAPIVGTLLSSVSTPPAIADFLTRSLPADLVVKLDAPVGDGGQTLSVTGSLGSTDAKLEAKLAAGVASALTAPVSATLNLNSATPQPLTAQLGLGDIALFDPKTPLNLMASIEGAPASSYGTHLTLGSGSDRIDFTGSIIPGDFTNIGGDGEVAAKLADPSGLVAAAGAGGIYVPALDGKAHLKFTGLQSLELSGIDAAGVSGQLALNRRGADTAITGSLSAPALDARALLPVLAGASSTVAATDGVWPDGPIDIGGAPRTTTGRIDVKVAALNSGATPLLTDASFGFDWDSKSVHLRDLSGSTGNGTLVLDATVCCSNAALIQKQVSGRLALNGVALDAVAPAPVATGLNGTVTATAEFDGTGETLAQVVAGMTGTGSYTINDFSAAHFDPAVFKSAGSLSGVLEMDPAAVTDAVTKALADAPFAAPAVTGSFTIAGGVVRSPNLAITSGASRIFGGANLALRDLSVDARYAMTPTDTADDANSAIDTTTAEVAGVMTGPLWAPQTSYDVGSLVDGMKIKANEIELATLEKRQAEDLARQQAAAAEQARVAAEQAAKAAADAAAKKAADDAAAKAAADAAAKKAADDAAARAAASSSSSASQAAPVDLGL